jgi:hypothetical protein
MALKAIYEDKADIPEEYAALYAEKNDKWELTGIEVLKTQADIDRISGSLTKERDDHRKAKDKLKAFGELDPTQAQKDADEISELKVKVETLEASVGEGKPDEAMIEKLVEARVATISKPIQRELDKARVTITEQGDAITAYDLKNTNRTITDAVRLAASESKVIPSAVEDALMLSERVFEVGEDGSVLTRDGVGVTPGIDPSIWLSEMQDKRSHWWLPSQGGGAGGGSGGGGLGSGVDNPFSFKGWNMTAQGAVLRADPDKAARLATSAGTTVGGPKPANPMAKAA